MSGGLTADHVDEPVPLLVSRHSAVWRLVMRKSPALVGAAILVMVCLVAVLVPVISPYGPREQVGLPFESPSSSHWLGLDDGGIDVVTLLMWGARVALLVGFAAGAISIAIGTAIGLVAGYQGGWLDGLLMRVTDCFLVIPVLPLMIIVAALWGATLMNIILIIGLLSWTITARVIRAQVKSVRERMFVRRAHSVGAGHTRIVLRYVLPQIAPLVVASTAIAVGNAIFFEAALSFLGLGDPDHESWGRMIDHAFRSAAVSNGAWWAIVPPGLGIALVILACSLLGRAVEDALNPRLAVSHLSAALPARARNADAR